MQDHSMVHSMLSRSGPHIHIPGAQEVSLGSSKIAWVVCSMPGRSSQHCKGNHLLPISLQFTSLLAKQDGLHYRLQASRPVFDCASMLNVKLRAFTQLYRALKGLCYGTALSTNLTGLSCHRVCLQSRLEQSAVVTCRKQQKAREDRLRASGISYYASCTLQLDRKVPVRDSPAKDFPGHPLQQGEVICLQQGCPLAHQRACRLPCWCPLPLAPKCCCPVLLAWSKPRWQVLPCCRLCCWRALCQASPISQDMVCMHIRI